MMLIRGAASIGIALILTAAPAMAGLVGPQRIEAAPDIQQVQYGGDAAGAMIGGAIAGIVGGALSGAIGGNCYYNDCDDDGGYGDGFYGGPGYYGGPVYGGGGFYRGGRGFHHGGFHGGGFHGGGFHGGAMAHGGGHMGGGHVGGGHVGGHR